MNNIKTSHIAFLVCIFLSVCSAKAGNPDYLYVGVTDQGEKVAILNGAIIDDGKLLDKLVAVADYYRKIAPNEFWLIIDSELGIADLFRLRGLLSKAGAFEEKCIFYDKSTKKYIEIAINGPAKHADWLEKVEKMSRSSK